MKKAFFYFILFIGLFASKGTMATGFFSYEPELPDSSKSKE
ncbi:hypothetical protein [Bacillus sp. C30]